MMKLFSSWDYYYGSNSFVENSYKYFDFSNSTLNITTGNTYVFNCYFHDIISYCNGGAILISIAGSNFLVEKSSFYKCRTTEDTAGIRSDGGNTIFAFICGTNCISNSNDGFSSTWGDSTRKTNSVYESSVSHCEAQEKNIMYQYAGILFITSVNLSFNAANQQSSLLCYPNKLDNEINFGSKVSYCSFANNTAEEQYCIYFSYFDKANKHEICHSNIINNKGNRTLYSKGETYINHCSFLHNGDPCFFTFDSESKIFIQICYLDNINMNGSGTISQNENQISDSFILSLSLFTTGFCFNKNFNCLCTEKRFLNHLFIQNSFLVFLLVQKS